MKVGSIQRTLQIYHQCITIRGVESFQLQKPDYTISGVSSGCVLPLLGLLQ
jgi:hypothetical protein